ncbi:MAG TPA: flagellar filament capping protein FliD, partial [Rhodocyclaceae bacterium]|nr:flagellar filament capping protein FliD [Rhodocyclaceae bacterium]
FIAQVKQYGYYDATTKTAGTLQGDYTLRSAQSDLYKLISTTPTGATGTIKTLSDLGVSVQRDGTLSVDSTKLSNAVSSHYADVAGYLSGLGGAVKTTSDMLTGTNGMITNATASLNADVKDIGNRRDQLNARLTAIEARYRSQFTALDTLISNMTATSTYLTQQLAALPSASSSSSK